MPDDFDRGFMEEQNVETGECAQPVEKVEALGGTRPWSRGRDGALSRTHESVLCDPTLSGDRMRRNRLAAGPGPLWSSSRRLRDELGATQGDSYSRPVSTGP